MNKKLGVAVLPVVHYLLCAVECVVEVVSGFPHGSFILIYSENVTIGMVV